MAIFAFIFSLSSAHAAGSCLANFAANLNQISVEMHKLSDTCWKQVEKGEKNTKTIMDTCSQGELTIASNIRNYRDANRDLCHSDCRPELLAARVCINGKSLQYYINQARSR